MVVWSTVPTYLFILCYEFDLVKFGCSDIKEKISQHLNSKFSNKRHSSASTIFHIYVHGIYHRDTYISSIEIKNSDISASCVEWHIRKFPKKLIDDIINIVEKTICDYELNRNIKVQCRSFDLANYPTAMIRRIR